MPAFILGILALFDVANGLVLFGTVVPGPAIIAGGVLSYLALLLLTYGLLHRPVTSELFIIVLWTTVAELEINTLVTIGTVSSGMGTALAALCLISALVSIVCYQRFFNLDAVAAFVDGAIPLVLASIMTGAIALCANQPADTSTYLSGADFGIQSYVSPHDADNDGTDDQSDILALVTANSNNDKTTTHS